MPNLLKKNQKWLSGTSVIGQKSSRISFMFRC
jgi:hypothetical protein